MGGSGCSAAILAAGRRATNPEAQATLRAHLPQLPAARYATSAQGWLGRSDCCPPPAVPQWSLGGLVAQPSGSCSAQVTGSAGPTPGGQWSAAAPGTPGSGAGAGLREKVVLPAACDRPGHLRSRGLIPRQPRVLGASREVAADACDKTVSDCLPAHPRPRHG